jgi:hypothetical protein
MVTLNCGKDVLLPVIHAVPSQPTTDDTEMRVCRDEDRGNEDKQIQAIDVYVR